MTGSKGGSEGPDIAGRENDINQQVIRAFFHSRIYQFALYSIRPQVLLYSEMFRRWTDGKGENKYPPR